MENGSKTCSRCHEVKDVDAFNRDRSKGDGHCSTCRECSRVRSADWYSINADQAKVNRKRRHEVTRDTAIAQMVRWREANRERKSASDAAWRRANPERVAERLRRRRAMKLDAYRAPVDAADIWQRDEGICQLCNLPIDPTLVFPHRMSKTLDHVIPLIHDGTHEPDNVQLAHLACNSGKRDRLI